jgi:iron complex outermembrane receptor protein
VNAGALAESSDIGGDSVSPRIMANWRVAEGHTLRVGASTAFRPPSAFEKYATVRYYDTNGLNPITTVENTGRAGTEKVLSQELGYNFGLPGSAFSADVRVFNEAVRDGVGVTKALEYKEALNGDNFRIQGLEYQIAWKPSAMTRVYFSQSWTGIHVDSLVDYSTKFRVEHGAPELSSALVATHEMANGLALTLSHQQIENTALMSDANRNLLFSMGRTDVRVARKFRLASTKAEWALTVQSLDGPIRDGDRKFFFYPRALLTLRFEN